MRDFASCHTFVRITQHELRETCIYRQHTIMLGNHLWGLSSSSKKDNRFNNPSLNALSDGQLLWDSMQGFIAPFYVEELFFYEYYSQRSIMDILHVAQGKNTFGIWLGVRFQWGYIISVLRYMQSRGALSGLSCHSNASAANQHIARFQRLRLQTILLRVRLCFTEPCQKIMVETKFSVESS